MGRAGIEPGTLWLRDDRSPPLVECCFLGKTLNPDLLQPTHFVETFMVPGGWSHTDFGDPLTSPSAPWRLTAAMLTAT